ncbi:fibronectin type III domain-containing protein [Streptosporangium sp. NPDC049376]|uniref:fibronectin type III domain-containing protein n=1 Tax=Streptosporangium sp. NPDC049376 TaxID=3366192 RepID=UPI003789C104
MRFRVVILALLAAGMTGLGAPALADAGAVQASVQAVAAAWAPYTSYTAGTVVTHNGVDYQCLQSHTSLPGWEPDRVPALWKVSTGGPSDPTPPSTPGNLRVTGTSSSTVSLAWDASTDNVGVTGYEVYRGTTLVTTATGTTYTDSNLSPSSTYTYTVRARDAAGNRSPESSPVSATTQGDNGAPGQPGTASATSTATSITLTWGASSGTVTGYRVYEGATQKAQVTATTATISGLGACQAHTYTIKAYNANGESAGRDVTASTSGCPQSPRLPGAPYLYMGWGNPPNPGTVMDATGVKAFTMAFILAQNGCNPAWDGQRPLTGGSDQNAINTIKSKGGSVEISFGGWSGNKLGPNCSTPEAFAGAVQKVIDALGPAVVDFDIENTDEFENYTVQDRILNGLKIVRQKNPNVKIVVTIPTFKTALSAAGVRLVNQAKALGAPIDNYTIMPFNFSGTEMYQDTVNASEGLKSSLKSAFGWSDSEAYAHMGISGMNGKSDNNETTTPAQWTKIRDWAISKGLTRFSFWAVNRDRVNGGGVPQAEWEFTKITAGF